MNEYCRAHKQHNCEICFIIFHIKNEIHIANTKRAYPTPKLIDKNIKYPPFSIWEESRVYLLGMAKKLMYRIAIEESYPWIVSFDMHFMNNFQD